MKSKRKTPPINMARYGPVLDRDGDLDCLSSLCTVLCELFRRRIFPKKRRRILVLVSIIYGPADFPRRSAIKKIYTFGYLCRLYKEWEKTDFDLAAYEEKKHWDLENLERQGEKAMAWAAYGQHLHIEKVIRQEHAIQSLPKEKQAAQRKKFEAENGSTMIRIG